VLDDADPDGPSPLSEVVYTASGTEEIASTKVAAMHYSYIDAYEGEIDRI
jgi:hypothetical protein